MAAPEADLVPQTALAAGVSAHSAPALPIDASSIPAPPGLLCDTVPAETHVPKQAFPTHWTQEDVDAGFAKGVLVRGVFNVSLTRPTIAHVRPEDMPQHHRDQDIVVLGRQAHNRAVHGDIVVVHRVGDDGSESDCSNSDVPADNETGVTADVSDSDEDFLLAGPIQPREIKKPLSVEVSAQQTRRIGRVVAISDDKGRSRTMVCTLHPNTDPKSGSDRSSTAVMKEDKFLKAKPTDRRFPWILLRTDEIPKKFLKLPGPVDPLGLWPVHIRTWTETSTLPLGKLKGPSLGRAGDLEAEVLHCLIENNLDSHNVEFSDEQLDEVDGIVASDKANFGHEVQHRLDLREKRVFTIDPATARDLDDAIHVEWAGPNKIEVGVHIADVGHYLMPGSICDAEASRRCTSVYLVDRVLPMLPHALCNGLCSLGPDENKLAFSCFFYLDTLTGELVDEPKPWFKKTVIRSCCRFNYDEVQSLLDGIEIDRPAVYGRHSWDELLHDLRLLHTVTSKVRQGRMNGGALSINKTKMIFHTRESSNGVPSSYHLEHHSPSHWLIEELMLLANRCVATHLATSKLSDHAVLRKHEPPDARKAETLEQMLKHNLKLPWGNGRSASEIHQHVQEIYRRCGSSIGQCVEMMVMRSGMKQAEYFVHSPDACAHHFALNFDYYTHFTSPIRRYPDVMVHRVLAALLSDKEDGFQKGDDAEQQVAICNEKKSWSRRAQEQLDCSVFCVYLRSRSEWFYTKGAVLKFEQGRDSAITVYVPQLGVERKVVLRTEVGNAAPLFTVGVDDQLLLPASWNFQGRGQLLLTWKAPDDSGGQHVQQMRVLSCVPVVVVPTNTVPIGFEIFCVSPYHRKYNQTRGSDTEMEGFEWHSAGDVMDVPPGMDVIHQDV